METMNQFIWRRPITKSHAISAKSLTSCFSHFVRQSVGLLVSRSINPYTRRSIDHACSFLSCLPFLKFTRIDLERDFYVFFCFVLFCFVFSFRHLNFLTHATLFLHKLSTNSQQFSLNMLSVSLSLSLCLFVSEGPFFSQHAFPSKFFPPIKNDFRRFLSFLGLGFFSWILVPFSLPSCQFGPTVFIVGNQYLSIYLAMFIPFFVSVFRSFCLSVFRSRCLSVFQSIYLSVHLSICLIVFLSFCLSLFLSFCLFLSISLLWEDNDQYRRGLNHVVEESTGSST